MRSIQVDTKEARQALVSLLYYVYCFEGKESMIHVYAKWPQCIHHDIISRTGTV